jgi:hypothetical protein
MIEYKLHEGRNAFYIYPNHLQGNLGPSMDSIHVFK